MLPADLLFPPDFPLAPPLVRMPTGLLHADVAPDGPRPRRGGDAWGEGVGET